MSFSENLKSAREKAGLSQQKLSDLSGVSKRAIQGWESGEKNPKNLEYVRRVANVLNTTTEALLSEAEQYVIDAYEKGGVKAAREIEKLVNGVAALFAGGSGAPVLDQEEKDGIMAVLNEVYWETKRDANKSFEPTPYKMKSVPKMKE